MLVSETGFVMPPSLGGRLYYLLIMLEKKLRYLTCSHFIRFYSYFIFIFNQMFSTTLLHSHFSRPHTLSVPLSLFHFAYILSCFFCELCFLQLFCIDFVDDYFWTIQLYILLYVNHLQISCIITPTVISLIVRYFSCYFDFFTFV